MEQRINLISLSVKDVGASVDFYRRAFGWEPAFVVEDTAFFDMGGVVFGLWSGLSEELGRDTDPSPGAATIAQNLRSPQEVDDAIAQAVAGGATVASAARTMPWGGYSGHIADLEGHLWEFAYNPDWPLDEDGQVVLPW